MNQNAKTYVVFKCSRCKNYTFAKINQKTRRCTCGSSYRIADNLENIINNNAGKLVEGITAANKLTRNLQYKKSALLSPGFQSNKKTIDLTSFTSMGNMHYQTTFNANINGLSKSKKKNVSKYTARVNKKTVLLELQSKILKLLKKWQSENNVKKDEGFPLFVIDMMIEEANLSENEEILKNDIREGILRLNCVRYINESMVYIMD